MGIKELFQEGMKERRRRKSLGQRGRELRDKDQALALRLTALGQKAWEANLDLAAFPGLRAALGDVQRSLDDLRGEAEQFLSRQQEAEEKRKRESSRLAAALKEAEEGLQGVQKSLNAQKGTLQSAQKEAQRSRERLAAIGRERGQLQGKAAGADASEAEKGEIAKGLALLEKEETSLKSGLDASEAAARPAAALVTSLQEQAEVAKKKLEALRLEQKKVLGDLDKELAALKDNLAKNGEKAREAETKRRESYRELGETLADAKSADPALSAEMDAVGAARSEKEGVQAMIGGLERQKDDAQVGAYKKMMALIIGGLVLLAALAVVLVLLLSPKKNTPEIVGLPTGQVEAMQQILKMAETAQKEMPKPADRGKAQTAADEAGLALVDEILATFDRCVAEAAALAKDRPEAAVLLPQLEKLYAGYGEKMAALNARFLALRDQDVFAFRRANGAMSQKRPQHVFAKDNALSQAVAYYNFEKGEQEVVDMLSRKIVRLLDQAVQQS